MGNETEGKPPLLRLAPDAGSRLVENAQPALRYGVRNSGEVKLVAVPAVWAVAVLIAILGHVNDEDEKGLRLAWRVIGVSLCLVVFFALSSGLFLLVLAVSATYFGNGGGSRNF